MNKYIELMGDVLNYIEENIKLPISLKDISGEFHFSEYHFDRMFRAIIGTSAKKYIQERKLTLAAEALAGGETSVLNTALDFGFEYPEVFSRSFKKHFGFSPSELKQGSVSDSYEISKRSPAKLIEREFVNTKGQLSVRADITERAFSLYGLSTIVDQGNDASKDALRETGLKFIKESREISGVDKDKYVSVIKCMGDDVHYNVMFAREAVDGESPAWLMKRNIEHSRFAVFTYLNDIYDIEGVFIDDLFRWIAINEYTLKDIGVGVIIEYLDSGEIPVNCWIPIE